MANVVVKKDFLLPKESGKYHRILCLTGQDKGTSYFLSNNRIVAGRAENADIVIRDKKASRDHFEIVIVNNQCILSDLGSHNGVFINDLRVKQHKLVDGDKIIIGQTVYKYSIHLVEENLPAEVDESLSDDFSDDDKNVTKKKSGKSKLMIILVVLILGSFLFDDSGKKVVKKKNTLSRVVAPLQKKNEIDDVEVLKKFGAALHRGQREMREKNFFRAIDEFNLALMLKPSDGQASFYINKAKKELDEEIESYFIVARRDYESVRYESSLKNYCSVLRLLERYKTDQRYKDAIINAEHIIKFLGYEETGEEYCFER